MNNNISLLKRGCVQQHNFHVVYRCPICLKDYHGKSPRFENAQFLINHLRGKHPSDQSRRTVHCIIKNIEIAIELGMISI